jgi:hypothetical protein
MLQVLATTTPIFLLIALGYGAARFAVLTADEIRAIGKLVVRFALPALVFKALSQRSFAEIVNFDYLAVYSLASLVMFLLIYVLSRRAQDKGVAESALRALAVSCSNSGFIGYPVALLAIGHSVTVALALNMIVENVLIIPLGLTLAESDGHQSKNRSALLWHLTKRLMKNPLMLAILVGLAFSMLGLKLPEPIFKSVDMLATASTPAALFAVGGALFGLNVKGMHSDLTLIVVSKLILHPLAVFLALMLVPGLDPNLKKAMLIFASAPMMSILPLLARPYGQEQFGAAAVMIATIVSFVTMSALLLAL